MCEYEIRRLQEENERLKNQRDDAWHANMSAAVCADHIEEFTRPGCLVCDSERLAEENERLKKFADKMFGCAFEGHDIEGSDIQDIGYELELLELRKVDPSTNEWEADELYFPIWSKP